MSKYTTEVRFICESYCGLDESVGYGDVNKVIDSAMDKVFDFEYPIFDEAYRGVLQKKILKHYYTKEIGAETVGLWKLWLDTRLNEIMPYYNKLYESETFKFNPLYDVDITREHSKNNDGTKVDNGDVQTNETSKNENYFSNTPQGSIDNLEDLSYLTTASIDKNSNQTSGTSNNKTVVKDMEQYLERVKGKNGGISYAKMLEEYRSTLLNIDKQIIDELGDLFMNIW